MCRGKTAGRKDVQRKGGPKSCLKKPAGNIGDTSTAEASEAAAAAAAALRRKQIEDLPLVRRHASAANSDLYVDDVDLLILTSKANPYPLAV